MRARRCRSPYTFDHGNRSTCNLKCVEIKWNGEKIISQSVNDVSGRKISGEHHLRTIPCASPDSSDCTTILVWSSEPRREQSRTFHPAGVADRQNRFPLTISSGVPPLAETRIMPFGILRNTQSCHPHPNSHLQELQTSHKVTGAPPLMAIFFSLLSAPEQ